MAVYETDRLLAWRRATDAPLAILAIGSLPLLLLEIDDDLIWSDRLMLGITNVVVLVAFAVDYIVELMLATRRSEYVRAEWLRLVIVVAQAVAVLPGLAGLGSFRFLRGMRVVRTLATLVRVVAIGGLVSKDLPSVLRRHAGGFSLGLAGFTWITSAVGFTIAEDVGENGRLHSFFDALWWSTATITTVGYGDVFPVTGMGRVIGGFTMVVGIATFATVTAKMAEFLTRSDAEAD